MGEEELLETSGSRPVRRRRSNITTNNNITEMNPKEETEIVNETNTNSATGNISQQDDPTDYMNAEERELTEKFSDTKPSGTGTPLDNPVIEHDQAKVVFTGDTSSPLKEQITTPVNQVAAQQTPARNNAPLQEIPPPLPEVREQQPQQDEKQIIYPNQTQQKEIRDTAYAEANKYATENLKEHDKNTQAPANPALTTMSRAEIEKNTAQTVETAIWLYCKLKQGAVNFVGKTSDRKLNKLEKQGKIDRNWCIFYDAAANRAYSVSEMVKLVNQDVEKAGTTDPKFIEKMRPLLIDEFTKRGWALSPQQNIFLLLGQDLLQTVQAVTAIKMNVNEMLDKAAKEFAEEKKGGGFSQRQIYNRNAFGAQPQQVYQQPPQTETYTVQQPPQQGPNTPAQNQAPENDSENTKKEPAAKKETPTVSSKPERKTKKPQD